eukprot:s5043_g8.t2
MASKAKVPEPKVPPGKSLPPSGRGKTPKPPPKFGGPCATGTKDHRSVECPDRFAARRIPSANRRGGTPGASRRSPSAAKSLEKRGAKAKAADAGSGACQSDPAVSGTASMASASANIPALALQEDSPGMSSATRWAVERVMSARLANKACTKTSASDEVVEDPGARSVKPSTADSELLNSEAKTWETIESFCLQLQPMAAASAAVSAVAGTGAAVIEARLPDISTSAALAEVAFPKREEEGEAEVDQELVQEVKEKEDKEEKGSDGLQEASFSPALKSTATSGLPRDAGDKEELVRDASICKPPSPEREGLTRLTAKDETAESVVFSPGTADGQENVDEVAPEESQDVVRLPAAAPLVEPSSLAECDEPVGNTEDTATSSDEALELRLAPATPCSQEDRRHPDAAKQNEPESENSQTSASPQSCESAEPPAECADGMELQETQDNVSDSVADGREACRILVAAQTPSPDPAESTPGDLSQEQACPSSPPSDPSHVSSEAAQAQKSDDTLDMEVPAVKEADLYTDCPSLLACSPIQGQPASVCGTESDRDRGSHVSRPAEQPCTVVQVQMDETVSSFEDQDLERRPLELQVTPAKAKAELTAELASACARLRLEESRNRPSPRTTTSSSSILGRFEQTSSLEPLLMICQEVPSTVGVHPPARGSVGSAELPRLRGETPSMEQEAAEAVEKSDEEFCQARAGDGSSKILEQELPAATSELLKTAKTAQIALASAFGYFSVAKLGRHLHAISLKESPAVLAGAMAMISAALAPSHEEIFEKQSASEFQMCPPQLRGGFAFASQIRALLPRHGSCAVPAEVQ